MAFISRRIWYDRQKILGLISVFGKVEDHREVYKLLVEAKKAEPLLDFRYDLREYVRFSADEGFVHDDIEALASLGYLEETESLKLTRFGKDYLKKSARSISKDIEVFRKIKPS